MKLPHSVCEVLRDHVVLHSECIDRMYLNGKRPANDTLAASIAVC
jgi:hypothetical protein